MIESCAVLSFVKPRLRNDTCPGKCAPNVEAYFFWQPPFLCLFPDVFMCHDQFRRPTPKPLQLARILTRQVIVILTLCRLCLRSEIKRLPFFTVPISPGKRKTQGQSFRPCHQVKFEIHSHICFLISGCKSLIITVKKMIPICHWRL